MSDNAQWSQAVNDATPPTPNAEAEDDRRFFTWILHCRHPENQVIERLFGSTADVATDDAPRAPVIADAVAVVLPATTDGPTLAEPREAPVVAVLFPQSAGEERSTGQRPATKRRPARSERRNRQQRAASGWESLTPTELEVATLAAEGLTNRQIGEKLFISGRTAETHLSHVYQKLGVSGRAQVAAEVARRRT